MKNLSRILAFLLLFPSFCFGWSGECVGVSDGDSITVMHEGKAEKIRLYGIDCPEKKQDFGTKAKQFTSDMVYRQVVNVEPVTQDRYGRTVAWVSVNDRSLNRELMRAGLAWWFRKYAPNDQDLEQLEQEARKTMTGLWSHSNPVPPWEYRAEKRRRVRPADGRSQEK